MHRLSPALITLITLLLFSCSKKEPMEAPFIPQNGIGISLIEDEFELTPIVVVGSKEYNFIVSFHRNLDGNLLSFEAVQNKLPIILKDNEGNEWNIFGRAVSGPHKGEQLQMLNSGMGYWFAFGAMYPGLEIYGEGVGGAGMINETTTEDWLIPTETVVQASGQDAIPALDEPVFLDYTPKDFIVGDDYYVKDNDLVIGFCQGNDIRAYPHPLLNWHEIANDEVGGLAVGVIYCPLAGTAKVWKREINDEILSFGVSGLLYNSIVIPFDRNSESYWTQLDARCVNGEKIGNQLESLPLFETTWKTWKDIFPFAKVATDDTGIIRNYSEYPYGNYRNNDLIIAPLTYLDSRLPLKERVHAVIVNEKAKVFRFSNF